MLSLFRQRGLSNILYGIIIAGTIFTFVIGFRPDATMKTASLSEACAARVRGRCIDAKDFSSAYRILMPSRSSETSRKMSLKRVALNGLVERELLDDEAKRLGISVTDDEVTDQLYSGYVRASVPAEDPLVAQSVLQEMYQSYVRAGLVSQEVAQAHFNDRDTAIPVDFRNAKTRAFDMKVYERQVRMLSNRSTGEFRKEQARELLAATMRDIVRAPVRVSAEEAQQEYVRRYETATLTYVPVKESWAARWAVDATDADVSAWVKEHQAVFDKALAERQKEDAPKAGHIRHILVKLPYGATNDEKALALAKLSWAASRIRAGESFAEVARKTSDDAGSAAIGGDVGDKTDGFVPPFKAAAEALRPGETTAGAVETQFGYHLIEKDDPAKLADVDAQVKRSLGRSMVADAKATQVASAIAKKIADAIRTGSAPADAARDAAAGYVGKDRVERLKVIVPVVHATADAGIADAGAPAAATPAGALPDKAFDASTDADRPLVETSTAFNRGGDPFPGLSPEGTKTVVDFAFSPSTKEGAVLQDAVRTSDAFNVVQMKQHKAATPEEFAKDRETFEEELLRAKRDEALSLYVRRLRQEARGDIKIDDAFVQESKASSD
ncbi:MAG: peptidylprolyl isomerase, partial [Polyangiaceae bacterium]